MEHVTAFVYEHPMATGFIFLFVAGLLRDYYQRVAYDKGAKTITETSMMLITPLKEQIEYVDRRTKDCEKRLLRMENANESLFAGIGILLTQITMLGARPLWRPNDRDRVVVTRGAHIEYQ
jgi:hypothetical protein